MSRYSLLRYVLLLLVGMIGGSLLIRHTSPEPARRRDASALTSCVIHQARLGDTTYGESIGFLRQLAGANVMINWASFASRGITPNAPIAADLELHDATVAQWLDHWTKIASTPKVQLEWQSRDDMILIDEGDAPRLHGWTAGKCYRHEASDLIAKGGPWEGIAQLATNNQRTSLISTADERRELLLSLLRQQIGNACQGELFIEKDRWLVVNADNETQNAAEQILDILRHAADHDRHP